MLKNLRRIAELVSREIVLKRRLPREFGGGFLFVSPDSGLKYYRRDLRRADPTLFQMAKELVRPGDVVWDIGANVGLFSFAAAGLAGSKGYVVAVEPDAWLVSLLRRSSNQLGPSRSPVVVIPAAVSDRMSLAKLHIASRGRSANFIDGVKVTEAGGTRRIDSVVAVTLDWLLQNLPPPQVLKIDVEGMEHRVLAGASELLAKARPRIWCEVLPSNADVVGNILRSAGYQIFNGQTSLPDRKPLAKTVWDTLAIPRELQSVALDSGAPAGHQVQTMSSRDNGMPRSRS